MKRRHAHLGFALAAAALAGHAAWQALALQRAERVNRIIAANEPAALQLDLPEAQLTRAMLLARNGDYDEALEAYQALTRERSSGIGHAALYNLGNLNLREALRRRERSPDDALPYLELAKQNYRDLLRARPDHWDARFNLERALRLAPEVEREVLDAAAPVASERAITTMRGGKAALP